LDAIAFDKYCSLGFWQQLLGFRFNIHNSNNKLSKAMARPTLGLTGNSISPPFTPVVLLRGILTIHKQISYFFVINCNSCQNTFIIIGRCKVALSKRMSLAINTLITTSGRKQKI